MRETIGRQQHMVVSRVAVLIVRRTYPRGAGDARLCDHPRRAVLVPGGSRTRPVKHALSCRCHRIGGVLAQRDPLDDALHRWIANIQPGWEVASAHIQVIIRQADVDEVDLATVAHGDPIAKGWTSAVAFHAVGNAGKGGADLSRQQAGDLLGHADRRNASIDRHRQAALAWTSIPGDIVRQNEGTGSTRRHAHRAACCRSVDGPAPADRPAMSHRASGREHRRGVGVRGPGTNRVVAGHTAAWRRSHGQSGLTGGGASKGIRHRQLIASGVRGLRIGERQRRCGRQAGAGAWAPFLPAIGQSRASRGSRKAGLRPLADRQC